MSLPLLGKRVLVTRSRRQSSTLASELERQGATAILVPTIAIAPPSSFDLLDESLANLATFDWLILTSANAVESLGTRLHLLGIPPTLPKLAAVGPSTADLIREKALVSAATEILQPARFTAEALAAAMLPKVERLLREQGSARLLLVRAEEAPDLLPRTLAQAGAEITLAPAYRTILPAESMPLLHSLFAKQTAWPHAITFTSSSTATHLAQLLESAGLALPDQVRRISIGPVTSQTLRDLNLPPHAEAAQANIPSLVEAVVQALGTVKEI